MAFTIKKSFFEGDIKAIKVIPYYKYGICIRIHGDNTYELWNYDTIPLSSVAKAVEGFLKDNPVKTLLIQEEKFVVPKIEIREKLFLFLVSIDERKLKGA